MDAPAEPPHLRNLAIDRVKIDQSFVSNMNGELESNEIVAALVGLGRGLGLKIIAEGVEGPREEKKLFDLGCQEGQGFLFSEAISNQDALILLETERSTKRMLFEKSDEPIQPHESRKAD